MELEQRHLEQIGEYVKSHFAEWMSASDPARNRTDPLLLERMVRVEEELKAQRDLMQQGFNAVDKRFEDLIHYMDKRFDAVDRRFESMDKRFESMDKRFESMDKRFESMEKRFSSLQWLIGIGISLIAVLMTVYEFIR
jgi:predicted RNase H-like nuclease (RuvC/YqgF family)